MSRAIHCLTFFQITGRWDLGLTMCLLWTGSDVFLSTTSILHLCAIAIHRYYGIANPLRMRSAQDTRHVLILVIPAWSISFAITLPLIIQGKMDSQHVLIGSEEAGYSCGIFDRTFAIYSSLVSFFIPLAIMLIADIRSIHILRKNIKFPLKTRAFKTKSKESAKSQDSRESCLYEYTTCAANDDYTGGLRQVDSSASCAKMENANSSASNSRLNVVSNSPNNELKTCSTNTSEQDLVHVSPRISPKTTRKINGNYRGRGRSKSMVYISMLAARGAVKLNSRERRAERALIWVFVCFVVCWLPFFTTNLTYGVCRSCDIPSDVFLTFTWLGYLSSGVNPCIYTLLNKDFRSAFISLLTCGLKQPTPNKFSVGMTTTS